MVHEVALRLKAHHIPGVQRHTHLDQIGVAVHAVLAGGKVDSEYAALPDGVAGVHILVRPARTGNSAALCRPSWAERDASPTGREESTWSTWPPCRVTST